MREFGWSIAAGAVSSPNIWECPETYEAENRAVDPDGTIEAAIGELALVPGQLGNGWGDVLDVGCGTGFHLPRLAERARTVVGVEPHGGLVAAAVRRVAGLPNVTVRQGATQSLPVPDASVDLAHARWAYFFGPGCEPGLREVERVLRRGGLAVVLDHDSTRSEVGRWFAAGLAADGISLDAGTVERFWGRHGFARRRLDVRWTFDSRTWPRCCASSFRRRWWPRPCGRRTSGTRVGTSTRRSTCGGADCDMARSARERSRRGPLTLWRWAAR